MGGGPGSPRFSEERPETGMGRKLSWLIVIVILLLGAGWFVYWKLARPIPQQKVTHE